MHVASHVHARISVRQMTQCLWQTNLFAVQFKRDNTISSDFVPVFQHSFSLIGSSYRRENNCGAALSAVLKASKEQCLQR